MVQGGAGSQRTVPKRPAHARMRHGDAHAHGSRAAHAKKTAEAADAISMRSVPRDLAPWLRVDDFPTIPPEGEEDDWPRGTGQTFTDYVSLNQMKQVDTTPTARGAARCTPGRHKIYLQPLGEATDGWPDLAALAAGCSAFFGLPTEVLPVMTFKRLETRGHTRIAKTGAQLDASTINKNLKALLPADGFTLCGVTMRDIFKGDYNYLFGLAFMTARVGVFSFHRHQPNSPECEFFHGSFERQPGDEHVLLRRALQTLTHEIGHTFGLKHCVYFSCLMQGANTLEEAENRMPDLCAVCLRKLLYITRSESADGARARYERLIAFYSARHESFGGAHLEWVARRLGLIAVEAGSGASGVEAATQADPTDTAAVIATGASERAELCVPCEPCDLPSPTAKAGATSERRRRGACSVRCRVKDPRWEAAKGNLRLPRSLAAQLAPDRIRTGACLPIQEEAREHQTCLMYTVSTDQRPLRPASIKWTTHSWRHGRAGSHG